MSVQGPVPPAPYSYGGSVSTAEPSYPFPAEPPVQSPQAPPPPPGPGVVPPFVSPPTDGTRRRRWWALGIGGAAVVLLCVGGLFGAGALLVFGSQMVLQESQAAVTDYLTAIQDQEYGKAYDQMCPAERAKISRRGFQASFESAPRIESFRVAQPNVDGSDITVPATIFLEDGTGQAVEFRMAQDTSTGDFEVCGEVG